MPKPNIDARGVRVRRLSAILCFAAATLCIWPALAISPLCWIPVAICAASGAFCWYEASHAWCAARACGIKTRI